MVWKCFVIMPFSSTSPTHTEEYWNNHFERFLKVEIEKIPKLVAYRSEALRGDILSSIIKDLYSSDIVVANLTDYNSNVFYELGIRQTIKNGTITIAQKGTILPFDISRKGSIFYDPIDPIKDIDFCKKLNKALIDCIEHPEKPDSVVLEVLRNLDLNNKGDIKRKVSSQLSDNVKKLINKMIMDMEEGIVDSFFPKNYQKLEEIAPTINWEEIDQDYLAKYKEIRSYYKAHYSVEARLEAMRRANR